MRTPVYVLTLLVVGLFLACGSAAAAQEGSNPIQACFKSADGPMGIVKFARKFEVADGQRPPMPVPVDPALTLSRDALSGPVAMTDGNLSSGLGSALVAPRGAAASSPRQIADREIRKLIRRLD